MNSFSPQDCLAFTKAQAPGTLITIYGDNFFDPLKPTNHRFSMADSRVNQHKYVHQIFDEFGSGNTQFSLLPSQSPLPSSVVVTRTYSLRHYGSLQYHFDFT